MYSRTEQTCCLLWIMKGMVLTVGERCCNEEMSPEVPGWKWGDAANPQFLQAGIDTGTYTCESCSSAGWGAIGNCTSEQWAYPATRSLFPDTVLQSKKPKLPSIQFCRSVMSNSLWPHGLQHARPPCPSPTPGVYSNSCPSSWWCHPPISSTVIPPPAFDLSQQQSLF